MKFIFQTFLGADFDRSTDYRGLIGSGDEDLYLFVTNDFIKLVEALITSSGLLPPTHPQTSLHGHGINTNNPFILVVRYEYIVHDRKSVPYPYTLPRNDSKPETFA